MADELDHYRQLLADDRREVHPLAAEARAALAQPEPEVVGPSDGPAVPNGREPASVAGEPSDEDLLRMAAEAIDPYDKIGIGEYEAETECAVEAYGSELIAFARAVLARWGRPVGVNTVDPDWDVDRELAFAAPAPAGAVGPTDNDLLACMIEAARSVPDGQAIGIADWDQEAIAAARAVLARFGGRPAPATAGEVGELVAALHHASDALRAYGLHGGADCCARAADLLERQAAPVPVAVSERLPQAEDCDAEGRCWVHQPHEACPESPAWELMLAKYASANYEAVAWLPAHALPLPSGEVEA